MSLGYIGEPLPKEWCAPLLSELTTPKQWKTISTKSLLREGYTVYGANGKIGYFNQYTHEQSTIMITCRGATCGNLHISEPLSYINGNAMALDGQPTGLVGLKFLYFALKARGLKDTISGSAQPQITGKGLSEVRLPLAPLAEQKVIADKLDTLLAQVETTKARLERIPQILKRFRQSVLNAAVSGRLTEEWRSEDSPERSFKKLGDAEIEVKTGPFGSALHKSDYVHGGIPVINPMHISEGIVTPSVFMSVSDEKYSELAAWHLREGDVVVGRRGEMGRAAAVKGNKKCLCGTGSMILRAGDNALPKYLEFILRSPTAVNYFNSAAVGSTMVNLNQKVVKSLEVYFPPLAEQAEIVRRVDELFAHADRIEQQANNALARVNHLTQSILAKAFRGELTEQWRKDNPELIRGENSAEALLERIKTERAAMKPAQRTRKSKTNA